MRKTGIVIVVIGLVGTSVAWLIYRNMDHSAQPPHSEIPPVEVKLQTVAKRDVEQSHDLSGRTQAFRIAEIRPQVSGIVVKRFFKEGSDVDEGQQLYQIDPTLYQAAYDTAMAELQKAHASTKAIRAKQRRYEELIKIGGISEQEHEDNTSALEQSEAQVASTQAAVKMAKANLDYTRVLSPISGRIGKSAVTEGALVTANQAEALAVIQQLDKIYVDVTQSVGELRKMSRLFDKEAAQASVTLTLEGDSRPLAEKGVIQFADVTVDPGTGTVQLRILFNNPRIDLLPGMFVKAHIVQAQTCSALLMPQKAVIRNDDGTTTVWLADTGGKVKLCTLSLGQTVGDQWIVLSGLKEGDKIVTEGGNKLTPESIIKPIE